MGADRRAVLAGLAGLPFAAVPAGAIPSQVLGGPADPFVTYHQRILAIQAAVNTGLGDDAADPLMDAWGAIDREAMAVRPTTFAGAAGALGYARREFVQFEMQDKEQTENPSHLLILHLLDGAIGVLRQAATGGAS